MVKLDNIQTEVDASFLYSVLSKLEENPAVAKIFSQMSEIENSHAVANSSREGHHQNDRTEDLTAMLHKHRQLAQRGEVFGIGQDRQEDTAAQDDAHLNPRFFANGEGQNTPSEVEPPGPGDPPLNQSVI